MANLKKITFTLIGFFFINFIHGEQNVDSLKSVISKSNADTATVNLLIGMSKSFFNSDPNAAIRDGELARDLALKINYQKGVALANKNIGIANYLQGKYVEAINAWQQALSVYDKMGDKAGVANMLSNMGAVYFNQGDDAKSLELHLSSLKISEDIEDTLRIITSLVNIGSVYLNKEATYNKARDFFQRSYTMAKTISDQYLIGTTTANLGELYYKLNDDSTALVFLKESIKAYEGTEDAPYSLNYLGRVYVRQKKYDLAIQTHLEAFNIAIKLDTKLDQTQSLVALAQAYYAKGDIDKAIDNYKKSLTVGIPLNATQEVKDAYQGLTLAYSYKKNFSEAFNYQTLLLAIKDTIYNINTDKKLGTLQFTFDLEKKQGEINLLTKDRELKEQIIQKQKLIRNGFIGGFAVVALFACVFLLQRNRISKEKKRSDELLLNILPEETAEELKATGSAKTKSFDSVSVLFTDFKNFTQASEKLSPEDLVKEINYCYSEFDKIVTKHGIEKIKTIGDAYMCAGGLPVSNATHPFDVVAAGIEMQNFIARNKLEREQKGLPFFELRLGIHTGPVVAGVVGTKKFAYDIWGDTVNTASRMESSGETGKVNISGTTYEMVKNKFNCVHRGKIQAKNKGEIDMYFVES
jgi:class 3 adenylate cyclase